jgi:hypothetical protein
LKSGPGCGPPWVSPQTRAGQRHEPARGATRRRAGASRCFAKHPKVWAHCTHHTVPKPKHLRHAQLRRPAPCPVLDFTEAGPDFTEIRLFSGQLTVRAGLQQATRRPDSPAPSQMGLVLNPFADASNGRVKLNSNSTQTQTQLKPDISTKTHPSTRPRAQRGGAAVRKPPRPLKYGSLPHADGSRRTQKPRPRGPQPSTA